MRRGSHHSPESNQKNSLAHSGKPFTARHCENLSKARIDIVFTDDHKKHMSDAQRRLKRSSESNNKRRAWMQTQEGKELISRTILSPESHKKRQISFKKSSYHKIRSEQVSGSNHPNWKGGISCKPYCPKWTKELRRRIRAFFNYECVTCGKTTAENGKQLSCHHVTYDKNACCDEKPVQFAALCMRCHVKSNYERSRWEAMLHRIIDEIYDGRSYYTREEMSRLLEESY